MKEWLRGLSSGTVNTVFAILIAIPFAMALIPPLYLWGASWKSGAVFLGQPFSMWYWNIIGLLTFFLMWAFYGGQTVRGDNDEHVEPSTPEKEGQ
jgi:hypothetical protein